MRRIAVLTPTYSDYSEKTRACIDIAVKELKDTYSFVTFKSFEVYIHAGRRKILQAALEYSLKKPVDYYLWLDSDIEFKPSDIVDLDKLIDQFDSPIIATGLYFSRHGKHHPMTAIGNDQAGYNWEIDFLPGKIYTDRQMVCGFGFCMMPSKAINGYVENYPCTMWFDSSRWNPATFPDWQRIYVVGEDLDFCEKARKIGITTWLHAGVELSHAGITRKDWTKDSRETHCPVIVEEYL